MRPDDLLEDINDGSDSFGGYNGVILRLRRDLVGAVLVKPIEGTDDLELLLALTRLLHRELQYIATSAWQRAEISDTADQRLLFRALQRVSQRNKIAIHQLDFRDYEEFKDFVLEQYGTKPDEAKIRRYLGSIFNPIEDQVHTLQDEIWDTELLSPISPRAATGWAQVDNEIAEMRQQFRSARTQQAHSSVGNSCNRILLFLSEAAFNPDRHLSTGEVAPPADKTKNRFHMIIDHELSGPSQASLRKVAHATVELAEAVKHRKNPSRTDAGIAADSVIMVVNLMRRITDDARTAG